MLTIFKKLNSHLLITGFLLVLMVSCVSSSPGDGVRETISVESKKYFIKTSDSDLSPTKSYVEIISSKTLTAFPHLKGNIGNILIGNGLVQAVVAGIPPQVTEEMWQKVIAGFFERKKEGVWQELKEIDSVWIAKPISNKNFYIKKGIDIKYDTKTGGAFVSLVFGPREGRYQKEQVRFFLAPGSSVLNFLAEKEVSKWRFNIKTNHGSMISRVGSAGVMDQEYRDVGGLVFYRGDNVFSLISNFLIDFNRVEDEILISPVKQGMVGFDLIQLVVGPAGGEKFPFWLASMARCNQNKELKAEFLKIADSLLKYDLFNACMVEQDKGFLTLDLTSEEESRIKNFQRSFIIRDLQNKLIAYSTVKSGSKVILPLPADKTFFVEENNVVLKDTVPTKVQVASQGSYVLMPKARKGADVEIALKGDTSEKNLPAFFELIDLSDPEGQNPLIAVEETASFKRVYDDVALINSFPVEMFLPEGQYLLHVFRGIGGTLCKARINIKDGEDVEAACVKEAANSFDAVKDYKEISVSPQALAVDSEAGLSLRLYSSKKPDDVLVNFYQKDQRGSFKEFSEIAKKTVPDSTFVLGCPFADLSVEEYNLLIKQFKPDGLELFGCGDQKTLQKFSKGFKELFASGKTRPPLVFPVSPLEKEKMHPYLPVVLIPNSKTAEVPEVLLNGDYVLSSGAFLKVKDVALNVKAFNKNPKVRPLNIVVDVEAAKNVAPKKLLFFTENGFVSETEIKDVGATKFSAPAEVKISDGGTWLRVELWGSVTNKLDESYVRYFSNVALAGTGFIQVNQK